MPVEIDQPSAQIVINASVLEAQSLEDAVFVAVANSDGSQAASQKMDGASTSTIPIAWQRTAQALAGRPGPGRALLYKGMKLVGAVGVDGSGNDEDDTQIANAGAAALNP